MTSPVITLDEQAAAVERAAKGIRSADVRKQTAALIAAAATIRGEARRAQSAEEALARMKQEDDEWLKSVLR